MTKDDDFKLLMGFGYRWTDGITDICECKVTFATEIIEGKMTNTL